LSNSFKIFAICCGVNLLRLIILFKFKIIILLFNSSVIREAYNSTGKYYKYLSDLGNQNPIIDKYAEKINASGDFNGLDIHYWNVLNNKKHFDINNPNVQLILAIHYLSLNDQEKRNEKWIAE